MRNKFPAMCYRCGKNVPEGEGHFERIRNAEPGQAKWRTQHAGCAVLYRGTKKHFKDNPDVPVPPANQASYEVWLKQEQERKAARDDKGNMEVSSRT